jgi:hypothetical protein
MAMCNAGLLNSIWLEVVEPLKGLPLASSGATVTACAVRTRHRHGSYMMPDWVIENDLILRNRALHLSFQKSEITAVMRKTLFVCIVAIAVSGPSLFAQNITISTDSVQKLLCKKWEVDHALVGGMKIGQLPGASEINYEFSRDHSFLMTSNDPKEKRKGFWRYDPKKKQISLTINGRTNMRIISLKEDEFVALADTKNATPDDPMEISLVYKPVSR